MTKNIVLLAWDCARRDHCSLYGYDRETTPFLDSIEPKLVYDQAISQSFWSLPVAYTVFTGKYPWQHGATMRTAGGPHRAQTFTDWRRNKLLPQMLQEVGYSTWCYSDNSWIDPATDIRGFDHFYDYRLFQQSPEGRGGRVVDKVIDTFRPEKPFFFFSHWLDAHDPYHVPEQFFQWASDRSLHTNVNLYFTERLPWGEKEFGQLRDRYDEAMVYMDYQLKRLVEWLSAEDYAEDTIFILYGDHGEYFGEHGLYHHTCMLYDEVLRVPLVVWGEGIKSKVNYDQIELRYVFNMVAHETGLSERSVGLDPYAVSSVDFPNLIMQDYWMVDALYDNPKLFSPKVSVRTPEWKYIRSLRGDEFYDLTQDPREQNNIYHPDHRANGPVWDSLHLLDGLGI